MNLDNNSISGDTSVLLINNTSINLQTNNLTEKLPSLPPKVCFFSIADNNLSRPISPSLCHNMIGKPDLVFLDLSNNLLSGEFLHCWMHWTSLRHLNLGRNNLIGKIPNSIGSLIELRTLRLQNNNLYGNILASLKRCKQLWFLDMGFNEFMGNIPTWINQLSMALLLQSNKFSGSIPPYICQLSSLLVLDLVNNRLSGPIPKCLYNITMMVTNTSDPNLSNSFLEWEFSPNLGEAYFEDLNVFVKGHELEYKENFKFVRMVDLSNNDLSGLTPSELFSLFASQYVNLSHNHLEGMIPSDIGHMRLLESLYISNSLLLGEISQSMSNLSFS